MFGNFHNIDFLAGRPVNRSPLCNVLPSVLQQLDQQEHDKVDYFLLLGIGDYRIFAIVWLEE
jgi:hypothetical protein